jgi:hypothetical protein
LGWLWTAILLISASWTFLMAHFPESAQGRAVKEHMRGAWTCLCAEMHLSTGIECHFLCQPLPPRKDLGQLNFTGKKDISRGPSFSKPTFYSEPKTINFGWCIETNPFVVSPGDWSTARC